jgi:hypothetical protein
VTVANAFGTSTVALAGAPFAVAITPDGRYAYVAEWGQSSSTVAVVAGLNSSSPKVATNLQVGLGPRSIAITPDVASQTGRAQPCRSSAYGGGRKRVRLHRRRHGEVWLVDDLDAYRDDAVLVRDS